MGVAGRSARDDDGAEPVAVEDDRGCVQAGLGGRNDDEAPRAAVQAQRHRVHARACVRLLERLAVGEDPEVGVRPCGIGNIDGRQPAVLVETELRAMLGGARAQQVARIVVEAPGEDDVEDDEQRDDGDRDRGDDHEQQAAADPERLHWRR